MALPVHCLHDDLFWNESKNPVYKDDERNDMVMPETEAATKKADRNAETNDLVVVPFWRRNVLLAKCSKIHFGNARIQSTRLYRPLGQERHILM